MLNVKKDTINKIIGKPNFNVGDLKRILNEIPEETSIHFGLITEKGTNIDQEEDLIFELRSIPIKDQGLDDIDSEMIIYVNAENYELKPQENSISLNSAMAK